MPFHPSLGLSVFFLSFFIVLRIAIGHDWVGRLFTNRLYIAPLHSQIGRVACLTKCEAPLQAHVSSCSGGGIELSQTLFTDLVIDKKIRPMALCAGL